MRGVRKSSACGATLVMACAVCALAIATTPESALAQTRPQVTNPTPNPAPARSGPLAPLIQQAKEAMDKGDYASALEPLQKYSSQQPDDPYTHFQLGYAYSELKQWDEAQMEFSRAIALDPRMAPAYLNLGLVLMQTDPAAAAAAFGHAADLQPTESRPQFLKGYALERSDKFPEAVESYRAALALSPKDYEAKFALGRVLLRSGDASEAEKQFQGALAEKGESSPARLGLANSLLAQKKYQAGADALGAYLALNPDDRSARIDRAAALSEIDRYDDSLAELDKVEKDGAHSSPTDETLRLRASAYIHLKRWKEANDTLLSLARIAPSDPQALTQLGHVQIEMHDYPNAVRTLGQARAMNPQSPDSLRELINALFLNENYSDAIGAMDALAKIEPPPPASWFVRAICLDKLSLKPDAIVAYQKFIDADNGKNETQDFQARRRIVTLQNELGQSHKKKGR